jgi:hypothetical protein
MNFALRIPDYYRQEIETFKGDVSINQFIITALSEKLASLRTEEYLIERAASGSRAHAINLLKSAPNVSPESKDVL